MKKQVKIIGLSIAKSFGGLRATELKFDDKNRLTVVKGEVGSGKTTLNRAMRLATQGGSTLTDKNLYGDIDVTTQLLDGDTSIFVGCRTNKDKSLDYFLYSVDADGNKIKDVVIDGQRVTPASYLKSLQTALTWRIDELTSENLTTQRNILLELYRKELEAEGVIFDKKHPDYTKSIIYKIEKAKDHRSLMDMRRKEVGGIADALQKKGVDFESRREEKDIKSLHEKRNDLAAKLSIEKANSKQAKENKLIKLKLEIQELSKSIKDANDKIKASNSLIESSRLKEEQVYNLINEIIDSPAAKKDIFQSIAKNLNTRGQEKSPEVEFDDKGRIISKSKDVKGEELKVLLESYKEGKKKYKKLKAKDAKIDTTELESKISEVDNLIESAELWNKEAKAINSFHDWREANDEVNEIQDKYYLKLTKINTGVDGLKICVDDSTDDNSSIFLAYDGSYDPKYFNNENAEMRKISSYSGTQKPMICLLIQKYFLSRKPKALPYLWIDDVPIDKKTRDLLEHMANELDLWLFVNWTGDFKAKNLKNGEILLENGELLIKE